MMNSIGQSVDFPRRSNQRIQKQDDQSNPFNKNQMDTILKDTKLSKDSKTNKIVSLKGHSNSVDLTEALRKHRIKSTFKAIIKSKNDPLDQILKEKCRRINRPSIDSMTDKVMTLKPPRAAKNVISKESDRHLPSIKIIDSMKSIIEQNLTYTAQESSQGELLSLSEKSFSSRRTKELKSNSSFNAATVQEQNLLEVIDAFLKTEITAIENTHSEEDNSRVIEEVCDAFCRDYTCYEDDTQTSPNCKYSMSDRIINFETDSFFYEKEMKNKIHFMVDYHSHNIKFFNANEMQEGVPRIDSEYSNDSCLDNPMNALVKYSSVPLDDLHRIKSGGTTDGTEKDLYPTEKRILKKQIHKVQIFDETFSLSELSTLQRFGSIL